MILKWDYRQLDISCADCAANFSPQPTEKLVFPAWFAVWLSPIILSLDITNGFSTLRARASRKWMVAEKRFSAGFFRVLRRRVRIKNIYRTCIHFGKKILYESAALRESKEREGGWSRVIHKFKFNCTIVFSLFTAERCCCCCARVIWWWWSTLSHKTISNSHKHTHKQR